MNHAAVLTVPTRATAPASLHWPARAWFLVALVGQWLFVLYIGLALVAPLLAGDAEAYRRTGPITGYVPQDTAGNAALLGHLLSGALLNAGGLLQLLPALRRRWPAWHRWNGRLFLAAAACGALSGLGLTWIRGSRLGEVTALALSLDGLLILLAAGMAWRCARQRRFDAHRCWAIRVFLLVSAVWTMRLGFMAWVILNQGPRGQTAQLDGPFDLFWSFGCYLLPLAIAELYFRAERGGSAARRAAAGVLWLATGLTALGVYGAWRAMWSPHL